jgi:hypothetical protein
MLNSFVIGSSRLFIFLLSALYTLLISTVLLSHLDLWARISISSLIILSFIHHLTLDALRSCSKSWVSLVLNENQLVVGLRSGTSINGELMQRSVITPACVVLCAKLDGYKFPVCSVIFRDAMPAEAFRQLRVRLKYQ